MTPRPTHPSAAAIATQMADTLRAVLAIVETQPCYPWDSGALKQQIREDITAYELLCLASLEPVESHTGSVGGRCDHDWQPCAAAAHIWQVCVECGEERHVAADSASTTEPSP